MTDVYVQPNHVAKTVKYLGGFFSPVVFEVPASYDNKSLLVLVEDGGGRIRDRAFFDLRVSVEVRAASRTEAFRVSRQCEALLRVWGDSEHDVHWLSQVGNVQYYPVDDYDFPAYRFTSELAFRGEQLNP